MSDEVDFTAAMDRLVAEAKRVPVDVMATVAGDLAGGPLEDLAAALYRVGQICRPGRPHGVARVLLCRAVVDSARETVDERTVDQLTASGDALWRAAGDAVGIVRRSEPCSIAELGEWVLDCDSGDCRRRDVCRNSGAAWRREKKSA